jgi:hypothetical protein
LTAQFAQNAATLRAEFFDLPDETAAKAKLLELTQQHGWKKLATHQGSLTDALVPRSLPLLDTTYGYDRHRTRILRRWHFRMRRAHRANRQRAAH